MTKQEVEQIRQELMKKYGCNIIIYVYTFDTFAVHINLSGRSETLVFSLHNCKIDLRKEIETAISKMGEK